ncbi:mannosyltransferase PIG-V [Jatrophihabitans sp. GAS493]|nr:mannosyltransferase PIG-V [Jatrophihabitans sp. GAS493]
MLWPAVAIWLAARAFGTSVGLLANTLHRSVDPRYAGSGSYFRLFMHWDSGYYVAIIQHGYFGSHIAGTAQAFFPGYPVVAKGVAEVISGGRITPLSIEVALWLVTTVASLGVALLIWTLANEVGGRRVALAATVLFMFSPYSVFLLASYSEALFLVFAIGAWLCGTRQQWLFAGLLCAAASFTRINGLFLFIALLVMFGQQFRQQRRPLLSRDLVGLCFGPVGLVAYFGFLAAKTGHLNEWQRQEQLGWGRRAQWPWQTAVHTVGKALNATSPDRRVQFALDLVFVAIAVIAAVLFLRGRQYAEATLIVATLVSLMTSYTYVSAARYELSFFPIFIGLADYATAAGRSRTLLRVVFALCVILAVYNTSAFSLGYWAD